MNEQAFSKFKTQLKPGGIYLLNSNRITSEVNRDDVTVISIPVDDIAVEIGNPKVSNIVIIGALIGATEIVSEEEFLESLRKKFASKAPIVMELNE